MISLMQVAGRELNFNPNKKFSLYYDSFNEGFNEDEDVGESESFFKLVMKLYFNNSSNYDELSAEESALFYNTSITSLYCTISKMCEDNIRQDELTDLLLSVFNDPTGNEFEIGDQIWHIIEDTLISFGVDLEEFEDEEEWDGYKHNWPSIANYLIENDVFDNDNKPFWGHDIAKVL